jgi:hypothetical protein
MHQDGSVVAVRHITIDEGRSVGNQQDDLDVRLNGIATSTDGTTIYVTVTGRPGQVVDGVLALPAF